MFLKSSFSVPPTSGFVAFDGGGAADVEVRRDPAEETVTVVAPRLEPELLRAHERPVEVANGWRESQAWQPATSRIVRRVEAVVIAALCAYFALGLAGLAGWF
jgi:hypothetical protein